MIIIKHTEETTIPHSKIWQILQDVANWHTWDHEIEFSRLNGPFQTGTRGCLKPKDGPILETLLTHVEPLKMFVQEAKLFFAKAVMTHSLTPQIAGKTQVTFQTEIRGPLAFLYFFMLSRSIKKKIPLEMAEMLKKAKALE